MECVQTNGYIRWPNQGPDHVLNFANYFREVGQYRKPLFVAEYGARQEDNNSSPDGTEAQLHSGLWASLVSPLSGAAMHWWWNYIDGADKYFHYKALADFSRDIDRLRTEFRPVRLPLRNARGTLRVAAMQAKDEAFCWVYHPRIFQTLKRLPTVSDAVLVVGNLEPGDYRVVYWDTYEGKPIGEETIDCRGSLELRLPPVHRDIAVKMRRVATE